MYRAQTHADTIAHRERTYRSVQAAATIHGHEPPALHSEQAHHAAVHGGDLDQT